jgi:hypothetical protein
MTSEALSKLSRDPRVIAFVLGVFGTVLLGALGWAWKQEVELSRHQVFIEHLVTPVELEKRFGALEARVTALEKQNSK